MLSNVFGRLRNFLKLLTANHKRHMVKSRMVCQVKLMVLRFKNNPDIIHLLDPIEASIRSTLLPKINDQDVPNEVEIFVHFTCSLGRSK